MPLAAHSATITVGARLTPLTIENRGALILEDGHIRYQAWNSNSLTGKVHMIQHLAARLSTRKINQPFTDRITAAQFPRDKYLTTTILNVDDALWGSTAFVYGELEDSKKQYSYTSIIADSRGKAQKVWQLQKKNSSIILLDKNGQVLFFKEGALTAQEIESTLELIKTHL
jgi:hypothetical protein